MPNPWNERFAGDEFAYGTEPSDFLAEHVGLLTGPVLSLAEGEGRNAVFMASRGLDVVAVDSSDVGLAKASRLAAERGVAIETVVADLSDYEMPRDHFGAVVSIWAHVPGKLRKTLHGAVANALKPGGIILLEAYAKGQLGRGTGGPSDPDRLMSCEALEQEFPGCEPILSREIEREVVEGHLHAGLSEVVQFIARKT